MAMISAIRLEPMCANMCFFTTFTMYFRAGFVLCMHPED